MTAGELVEEHEEGDWRITRRKTSAPIRMAGFNLGQYERVRLKRNGYTLEVCANRAIEPALASEPHACGRSAGGAARHREPEIVILPPELPPDPDGALAGNRFRDRRPRWNSWRRVLVRRRCRP